MNKIERIIHGATMEIRDRFMGCETANPLALVSVKEIIAEAVAASIAVSREESLRSGIESFRQYNDSDHTYQWGQK